MVGVLNSALSEQSESHVAETHWAPSTIALAHAVIVSVLITLLER